MKYAISWIVALAAIACGLLVYESDLLWKVQELNLFMNTSLFFRQQMVVPAGILTYVGTWLTQLFYNPWLGVTVLSGWWLLLLWLLKRTFAVPARWTALLLIPVALLLLTNVDLGYWIYMLKLRGQFFLTTLATVSVVALLWGFRSMPDKYWLRTIWLVLTGLVGYPLLGIYGLAATLLMGIWSWRLMARGRAAIHTVIAVLLAIAVPLFCYRYVYHETNLANIYYAGLPVFFITEEYPWYYTPYYLLALFMLVMVCLPIGVKGVKEVKEVKGSKKWLPWAVQAVALGAVAWGVVHFWYKDENFHHEVKMMHLIDQTDWEGVLQEAARQDDEPTRAIVMMRNLALSRLGRQGELMYEYRNGSKEYDSPFGMRQMLVNGPLVYYQYGLLNSCSRLCTEMGVEFGWRVEYIKLLARCAVLNNEQAVARKYINILKKTMYHKDWAVKTEAMLNNPKLIAQDKEMEPITHMLHFTDELDSDNGYVERYLMRQLANHSYSKDPIFQEQSLLASLWFRDSKTFWYHFNVYIHLHPNGPIPVAYQEAAYLYGKLEERPDLDKMPFSPGVKDSFEKFFQVFGQYEGMNAEDIRQQTGLPYSNTFYYNYYIMANLPEY
jgi:hypothetical protein